jgi:hypothetical protein
MDRQTKREIWLLVIGTAVEVPLFAFAAFTILTHYTLRIFSGGPCARALAWSDRFASRSMGVCPIYSGTLSGSIWSEG